MFFFIRKRRRAKPRESSIYYILAMLCMSAGMLIGYFNGGQSTLILNEGTKAAPILVFKYAFIKNSVMLFITYLNAFSLLGFPLNATGLAVNGYILTVSATQMLTLIKNGKFMFMLYNLPHMALVIIADIILSERVFRFSGNLFSSVVRNGFRGNFGKSVMHLTICLLLCLLLVFLAALYEGYIVKF